MSAAGAAGVAVNFPPLPAAERRTTVAGATTGQDTTTTVLSDEQKAALAASEAAGAQEEQQIGAEAQAAQRAAQAEQEARDRELAIAEGQRQEMASPKALEVQRYIDQARARTRDEESRLAGMPSPALYADRQGWDKVKLAAQILGGGLSEGMIAAAHLRLGMAAPQQHTVDSIIERDLERQRAAIAKASDAVVRARTGIKDAEDARAALMADIDLRGKEMYRRSELLLRGRLAALKHDQAAIDANGKIVDLRNRQAEKKLDYIKGHSKVIQSKWDSPKVTTEDISRTEAPKDGAGKLPGQQVALAKQALTELSKLEKGELPSASTLNKVQDNALTSSAADTAVEGAKPVSGTIALAGRAMGAVPRNKYEGLSEKDRIAFQTMDRAQQLLMHVMTGAGASMDEARKKAEAFGWTPGDTPASMKSKLAGAKELAHQFAGTTPEAAPAAAGAAPAETPKPTRSIGASAPARATKVELAREALKPGSGASEAEKAKAREILRADKAASRGK